VRTGALPGIGIFPPPEQVVQGGLAVQDMVDSIGHQVVSETADDQLGVVRIIFHQQNVNSVILHFALPHRLVRLLSTVV
tara:strand:+ start:570 stop:806 length:237 start_codon:yes stop_codon:yes gene_type:complete